MAEVATTDIGWKQFAARLIDSLRWPIAFVVAIAILRQPLSHLVDGIAQALAT